MIAELRSFENMDMNDANIQLKENLKRCYYRLKTIRYNLNYI